MGPQDGYEAKGSLTPTSTTGAEVSTEGCEAVAYQVLTVDSSPQVKAYGANPGGTFIPVRYRKITVAGVESLIDPDTASGALSAGDRIIVPNNGYDQIRVSTTAGTMTCDATRNFYGTAAYELQKLNDAGIATTSNTEYADDGTGFTLGTSKVTAIGAIADETSTDSVDEGDIGIPRMTLDRVLLNNPRPVSCHAIIPDGTDELLVSAAARKVYGVTANTIDATPVYVKLYDKATAPSEADTPIWRGQVPANATSTLGAGASYSFPVPIALTNGLGIRVVTGIGDADDTAVTTAENYVNTFWSA